ncbi:hypothetical protein DFH09DRAFT_1431795 [Mycena vulgaris]|nr:hypothetical protein DFH09DRAFT_1431795 [Mycena vulgaris]
MNQTSFAANSVIPLQKGKACVNCRRRKIPSADCEYTESGPSHGDMLEEQISILQARIEELKKSAPPQTRGPLLLQRSNRRQSGATLPISPSNTMALGPLLSYFCAHLIHESNSVKTNRDIIDSQQTSGNALNQTATNSMPTELPFIVLQALVHNFLHNASCFGFFLDSQAFHDAITSPTGRSLPPVLLNVMYLFGVHLSKDARITAYEPAFLAHALRSTAGSLAGTHPRTILHSMQASVLLAYYFVRNARFLEGRYHTSAAVSIAVSAGLHRIRAAHAQADAGLASTQALRAPRDAAEEGERISAFWSVLNLNNCWAGMDGASSNVGYGPSGLMIDTPWPLETRDYVERPHLLPLQSSGTITKFLAGASDDAMSRPALYAKAGIVFQEATRLSARYRATGTPSNDPEFDALDKRIDAFKPKLPPIQGKYMLVVHMLAHGATIQLHHSLAKERVPSRAKALGAARAVVGILEKTDVPKIGLIDPVLAPLWTSACLVFIAELARQPNQKGTAHFKSLQDALNTVIATMKVFAPNCRLMTAQLDAVRQAYEGETRE